MLLSVSTVREIESEGKRARKVCRLFEEVIKS